MKKVKCQNTYLQKYQAYVNKKVAAVCATTLLVSAILSPFVTSATSSGDMSYPIAISSVSEELKQSNDYLNVDLSYYDIEGTNLSVSMDVEINLDSVKADQEKIDVEEETTNIPSNDSGIENPDESSEETEADSENKVTDETIEVENPDESSEEIKVDSENEVTDETIEVENPDESSEETKTDSENEVTDETIEVENPDESSEETKADSENEILDEQTEPVVMNHLNDKDYDLTKNNSILNTFGQWLTNIFKSVTATSEFIAKAEDLDPRSIVLNFPVHSSFVLDKTTLKVIGTNGEELTQNIIEINENHLILEFKDDIPSEFNVSFILDLSETINSGEVIVNEGAFIEYNSGDKVINEPLRQMKVNLYELTEIMELPIVHSPLMQIDTANEDTSSTQRSVPFGNGNTLFIDKTATKQTDGSYLIELDTSGKVKPTVQVTPTDIVLVVDTSGSMQDKIDAIKDSIKEFTRDILSNNTDKKEVQVAIVTYAKTSTNLLKGFKSSYTSSVESKIDGITASGGTKTDAAIQLAADILKKGRSDALKYVVFFTDGLPTYNSYYSTTNNENGNGSASWDRHFKTAQINYYKNFEGPLKSIGSNEITIGGIGSIRDNKANEYDGSAVYNLGDITPIDAKFYSIGLFTTANEETKDKAINFLKTIQNVIDMNAYKDNYYTNNIEKAQQIYNNIKREIEYETLGNLLTNVTITDIVPSYFDIVPDSVQSSISGEEPEIQINPETNEKIITWSFDSLTPSGVKVWFNVVPNDYFGVINNNSTIINDIGINGVYTNNSAVITGNELDGNGEEYPKPHVSIPPIQGGIKVVKEVEKNNDLYNTTDKFSINVIGQTEGTEDLGFNVTGNNKQTVSFYLRDSATDISYNKDYSKNYLMAGSYSVDEILPANYEQLDINIQYCDETYQVCHQVESYDTFMLDKDHRYILITVTNALVNEDYWYDKENKQNKFTYTKPTNGESTNSTED